jgi:scyllo-inositol 2-dehydrogenase (NADP+)
MKKIQVGLIGYGLAGSVFHAPLIASVDRLHLAAVASSRTDQITGDFPGTRIVATPEELFADPNIELIVVASPNTTHYELARRALRAGKHVVVDKPVTTTVREADSLIALAEDRNLTLSVFQNRRWDNDFRTVKHCIEEGTLGQVYFFESHFDRFRPAIKTGWRETPEKGSGVLYDLGAHLIDQTLHLFGLPEAVTADVLAQRPEARVDDYFHLVLHYQERRAVLHASTLVRNPGPRFSVHGDGGSFTKYGLDGQEDALKAGKRPGAADWGRDQSEYFGTLVTADGSRHTVETLPGTYQEFYKAIASTIRDGAPVPVKASDARDTLMILEAALRSAAERRTVAVL